MVSALAWASLAAVGPVGIAAPGQCSAVVPLDGTWMLAPDPGNVGRQEGWWRGPVDGAKSTPVPWIIQEIFEAYHGVAWYWRDLDAPANPHAGGRYVLRFWEVDYLADVYVNGVAVGSHEGAEDPFDLDITDAVRPGETNHLAVRVLNPTFEPIDGIALAETPRRNKTYPPAPGAGPNYGGIVDSVELLVTPAARVTDVFARPDSATGQVRVSVEACNAGSTEARATLELSAGLATEGISVAMATVEVVLPHGVSVHEGTLQLDHPRPWTLSDPVLYRVTARLQAARSDSVDERSVRTGFRDFRFERGAFRLNGKRLFFKGSHTGGDTPVGVRVPYDLDLLRRDLLNVKAMGFNAIRFIAGMGNRRQLDLADELGLLVYEESYAGWCLGESPRMCELFDRSTVRMIRRDRNHPSVVIWGLLNETMPGTLFWHAADTLPLIRSVDDTRMVLLNSGRWDLMEARSAPKRLQCWRPNGQQIPSATYNADGEPAHLADSTWQPGQLALHPGLGGERSAARWTAPADGDYSVTARFAGIAAKPTTSDVHIVQGDDELFASSINTDGGGNEAETAFTVTLRRGEALCFIVGMGNGNAYSDTTALEARIEGADGTVHDAAKSFSVAANPSGGWEYGWLAADAPLGADSFVPYDRADPTLGKVAGGIANPGSAVWEDLLAEQHPYQRVPHNGFIINWLKNLSSRQGLAWYPAPRGGYIEKVVDLTEEDQPLFVSEYGVGSALDLCRLARGFEALGKADAEDAKVYRRYLDAFLADYAAWGLDEAFASPEDYSRQCLAKMGHLRMLGIDALRASPHVIGYSLTGTQDQGFTGEGLTTQFRELKPGTMDALFESFAPLRLCSFVEPVTAYRGATVHLEAVLSNEDILRPGEYPLRVQLVGPDGVRVFDRTVAVTVPAPADGVEPPFAIPAFAGDVAVDGPAGRYRFLATLLQGGAATGGEAEVYVYDAADMPTVEGVTARFGDDPGLDAWLAAHGIATAPLADAPADARAILVAGACPQDTAAWDALTERIRRGAVAVFLTPESLARGDESLGWLPLEQKGSAAVMWGWLYLKDEWAKRHPIFEGLQAGGLMDYTVYREIIPHLGFVGQSPPLEAVAGACKTSQGYESGLLVAVHPCGEGRLVMNALRVREELETNPVAERLLRNMLRYAAAGG